MSKMHWLILGSMVGLSMLISSCKDEETDDNPGQTDSVTVQFHHNNLVITEGDDFKEITLLLNKPATKNGFLILEVENDHEALISDPEMEGGELQLDIEKGASSLTFDIKAVDNATSDGSKNISITIAEVSNDLKIGLKRELELILVDDEGPVAVNFTSTSRTVLENAGSGQPIEILFSSPATEDGWIEVEVSSDDSEYGTDYTTDPAPAASKITIPVITGDVSVSFDFFTVDNTLMEGDKVITFTILNVDESLSKGTVLDLELTITDDDMLSTPKGYITEAGNWSYKAEFEYDAMGRILKRKWEQSTPGTTSGTDTYYYNDEGRLIKINKVDGEEMYIWENDRIIRMDRMDDGEMDKQIIYDYDEYGNVAGMAIYHKQPSGEMEMTMIYLYLYFLDGNVYKELVYLPSDDPEDPILHSTRTYESYLDAINPFPMVEPIPTVNSQKNLPGSYRLQENGSDLKYFFSYEFREDGLPSKRYVSGSGSEVTTYQYY